MRYKWPSLLLKNAFLGPLTPWLVLFATGTCIFAIGLNLQIEARYACVWCDGDIDYECPMA